MARQRDAGLDRAKASSSELCVARTEGLAAGAQAPGDAHQGVAVLCQALAADASSSGDRRGLIARRRKASGRVEVFGACEALDWQRVCAERRGSDDRNAGQAREDLPRRLGQEHAELLLGEADVLLQLLPAAQIRAKALRPQLGIDGWREQPLPALAPEGGCGIGRLRHLDYEKVERVEVLGSRELRHAPRLDASLFGGLHHRSEDLGSGCVEFGDSR
jgi:hypothetical protein